MKQRTVQANVSDDRRKILDFWSSNFPEWPAEKYEWFYESNPAGKACCWFAISKDEDSIIGTVALFPRIIYVNGVKNKAGIVGDFIMIREQRSFWPAFWLQKRVIEAVKAGTTDFVYGSPNSNADQLMSRSGYRIVGSSVSYKKIIGTYNYLHSRLHNRVISRAVSVCLDLVLRMFSKETYIRSPARNNISFQICTNFDERIDRLWEICRKQYTIIGERSAEFLNWRFSRCPYLDYRMLLLINGTTDKVCGYLVFRIENGVLTIADLLLENFEKHGDELFVWLLRYARRLRVGTIVCSFIGPEELKNKLRQFGFINMKDYRSFTVFSKEDSIKTDVLYDSRNWYFMEGDNDI